MKTFNNRVIPKTLACIGDAYKYSHPDQTPENTVRKMYYAEARTKSKYPNVKVFGLLPILLNALQLDSCKANPQQFQDMYGFIPGITMDKIKKFLDKYDDGTSIKFPITVEGLPEGSIVPAGTPLFRVYNNDPEFPWLSGFIETELVRVWAPITVATTSLYGKKLLKKYLDETAENTSLLDFMLHDFGSRGVNSYESAAILGAAHLSNFKGTDTVAGYQLLREIYGVEDPTRGFSVAATEHSTMTAKGEEGEKEIIGQLLKTYPKGILSVVADSYDIYRFIQSYLLFYKQEILNREGIFVVRPDSVDNINRTPEEMTLAVLNNLDVVFGSRVNSKGYKVLDNKVRVLWGDGIDLHGIYLILEHCKQHGWSAENLIFGMGGALLQKNNRDTISFIYKCCSVTYLVDGEEVTINVNKKTHGKTSLSGNVNVRVDPYTQKYVVFTEGNYPSAFETLYKDGDFYTDGVKVETESIKFPNWNRIYTKTPDVLEGEPWF